MMTIRSIRAAWQVTAGLIPGTPMPELSRDFFYSSDDFHADQRMTVEEIEAGKLSRFNTQRAEAQAYADTLVNPSCNNWVRVDWVWF